MLNFGMRKENKQSFYTTLDAYRAGFLKIRGHVPTLFRQDDKYVFSFPLTEKLKTDMADYEGGALVDALRYSLAVKSIKTEIHTLRREAENYEQGNDK